MAPLAPARGIAVSVLIGMVMWFAIIALVLFIMSFFQGAHPREHDEVSTGSGITGPHPTLSAHCPAADTAAANIAALVKLDFPNFAGVGACVDIG
jgi:hypothetical protein